MLKRGSREIGMTRQANTEVRVPCSDFGHPAGSPNQAGILSLRDFSALPGNDGAAVCPQRVADGNNAVQKTVMVPSSSSTRVTSPRNKTVSPSLIFAIGVSVQCLWLVLPTCAGFTALCRGAPAEESRAVPELAATDVVGAQFGDKDRIKPDHFLRLAGPPALAAG